jgi:hypothetical protein
VLELCLVRRRRRVAARIGEGLGGVRGRWREVSHFSLSSGEGGQGAFLEGRSPAALITKNVHKQSS